jgi:hypothetical protein
MVAGQTDVADTPSALVDVSMDAAWRLAESAADLRDSDVVDTLRILKDLEAIEEYEQGAAELPEQGHEDVDPMTQADELVGGGSSNPGMPGMPSGGDRAQMLRCMMETFRRQGAGEGEGDSQGDPFARVGWAGQDSDERPYQWVGPDGTEHSEVTYSDADSSRRYRSSTHPDQSGTVAFSEYDYSTGRTTGHVMYFKPNEVDPSGGFTYDYEGPRAPTREELAAPADMEFTLEEAEAEPDGQKGGGEQPNPADDSDGFGFLDRDPWAAFFAWYTGQKGPQPYDPRDDNPGGTTESGQGQGSAAPRVGPEAVTNPVDSLWGSSGGGGGGDGPNLPGCVFPDGPPPL